MHWFSGAHALERCICRGREEFCVNSSGLHFEVLCCSLKLVRQRSWGPQPPTFFSQEWVVCIYYSLWGTHRIVITSLVSSASVKSLPSRFVCLICLPVQEVQYCCVNIRHVAGFQKSKFCGQTKHELALLLWRRVSLCFCNLLAFPRKVLAQLHNASEFMVKHSKNPAPSVLSSGSVSALILMNKATHWPNTFGPQRL